MEKEEVKSAISSNKLLQLNINPVLFIRSIDEPVLWCSISYALFSWNEWFERIVTVKGVIELCQTSMMEQFCENDCNFLPILTKRLHYRCLVGSTILI